MVQPNDRLLKLLEDEGARLHRLLVRLTLRTDVAEDLLQELFLKLRHSSSFYSARSAIAFATRTAVNLAFDWRLRQTRRIDAVELTEEVVGSSSDLLGGLIQREQFEQVLLAMGELPEAQRLVLILLYVEHLDTTEIGRQIGKTAHQVRALSAKGLATLRANLKDTARREVTDG